MSHRLYSHWISACLFGLVYFALAAATLKLTRFHGGVALISVANAVLLARLVTLDRSRWLLFLVAAGFASAFATAAFGLGRFAAVPMALVNLGEVAVVALLLRQKSAETGMGSQARLRWFLLGAGLVGPGLSAFAGAGLGTLFGADSYGHNWLNWFAGHALGAITFTPVCVYLFRGDARAWVRSVSPSVVIEAMVLISLVLGTSLAVFAQDTMPLLFLPLLPMILATFRIGNLGAALSVALLTVVGSSFTLSGHGPIALIDRPVSVQVQFLQFYLACTVLTVLPVAAELARRTGLYRRLRESEARYRLLTENSTDIVLNLDVAGHIRFASPSIQQIGGYDPEAVIGRKAIDLIHADDVDPVRQAHVDALADPSRTVTVEYRAPTAAGELHWFETHTRAVVDEAGQVTGVVSAVRDVGHRKSVEQKLVHAALTDRLTGVPNRRAFDGYFDLTLQTLGPDGFGCVAMFDIDHFKRVNDQFGHATGDAVLRNFADCARSKLRAIDYIARFGGEEFVVILPDATIDQARFICDRLRAAAAASVTLANGHLVRITVSGGVALYDPSLDAGQVLAAADAALYVAKRLGRDRLAIAA